MNEKESLKNLVLLKLYNQRIGDKTSNLIQSCWSRNESGSDIIETVI